MTTWQNMKIYRSQSDDVGDQVTVPDFDEESWHRLHDPTGYEADPGLEDAVNVALQLGLPLLVTGEAGTGKSELAHSVATRLNAGKPLICHVKSTSTYDELLYRYDAVRHFQEARIRDTGVPVQNYVTYEPLGRAILLAADRTDPNLPDEYRGTAQRRSVVLIDEIDKAPRDLPNDVLNELVEMSFEVKEIQHTFKAAQKFRPILILTSNLEKDLPEAFRRRCAFYHIEFPRNNDEGRARLKSIVRRRLPRTKEYTPEMLNNAINTFMQIRGLKLEKRPATAELINWVDFLQRLQLDIREGRGLNAAERDILISSFSLLAKSDEDLRELRNHFDAGK